MKRSKKCTSCFKTTAGLLLAINLFNAVYAQDILTLKSGDVLTVKTIEIDDTEIKYKRYEQLDGPLRIINKSDAYSIKYANGRIVVFQASTTSAASLPPREKIKTTAARHCFATAGAPGLRHAISAVLDCGRHA